MRFDSCNTSFIQNHEVSWTRDQMHWGDAGLVSGVIGTGIYE